ncbi:sugar transporter [Thioalkalivibrio nitratireducens DSM 14787]|uniref:Sugar transporter n=1 Tax=Thioalkalivibrio nitratireducens (strain DSM 14787 / UNIQEM 213 / ALEN2) TaxID=1255043 RepID=L0DSG1_THIND|nr:MFS transporter [Thioalkalivibrio nitratireducens]AGA31927.1 sugar transporter [Thioalkalivibrio nitratireducens DSM 14787]
MTRTWPIALGIYVLMLPVTAMVPLLYPLTEGRYPGLSDLERHLFMSAHMAGALLFAVVAGLLSDRLGVRKRLIVPALFVNGGVLLLMAWPWPYGMQLLLRFIEGCAHITVLSLAMTLAADRAPRGREGGAMGLVGGALSLGVASGAVLGGYVGAETPEAVFFLGGGLMLAAGLAGVWILRDAPLRQAPQRLGQMLRLALQRRALLVPYAFTFVDRLTVGFIISTVSLYFATVLGFDPTRIGLSMAAFLLPFALLTYPAGLLCQRRDPVVLMAVGSLLYGLFLAGLGFASAQAVVLVMALGGVVAAMMFAPSLVLVTRLADPAQRATAMGGFHLAGSLGFMLGPLVGVAAVALLRALGHEPWPGVFLLVGALEALCVLVCMPWLLRLHRAGVVAPASGRTQAG